MISDNTTQEPPEYIDRPPLESAETKDKLPEIRIKDAWLLHENASNHLHELWGKDSTLADDEWMKKLVTEYNKSWKPLEHKILTAITDLLGTVNTFV